MCFGAVVLVTVICLVGYLTKRELKRMIGDGAKEEEEEVSNNDVIEMELGVAKYSPSR